MTELQQAYQKALRAISAKAYDINGETYVMLDMGDPMPRPADLAKKILALIRAFNKYSNLRGSGIELECVGVNWRSCAKQLEKELAQMHKERAHE